MTIHFVCPNGHELSAPEERAGKPGRCPKCQTEFLVPELDDDEDEGDGNAVSSGSRVPANQAETIVFLCPNGHKLNGPAKLKGRPGQCPHCGAKFRIPDDDDEPDEPIVEDIVEIADGPGVGGEDGPPRASELEETPLDEPLETVEIVEEVDEVPDAEALELTSVQNQSAEPHPLYAMLKWLCENRPDKQPILIRLRDGEVLEVDRFSTVQSNGPFAIFAVEEAADRFSVIGVDWREIVRVDLHRLPTLPQNW
ncbi:MAG: heavy metal-binding domain-containing protein [Pirellulaceae bacterium]